MSRGFLRAPLARWPLGAVALFAAVGVFVMPWFVPNAGTTYSESALVGFNNRVAAVSLGIAALVMGVLSARRSRPRGEEEPGQDPPVSMRRTFVLSAASALPVAVISFLTWGAPYWDASYFFDRLGHAISGAVPYREFGFAYGPLLLYPPALAARAGAGGVAAYYAFLVLVAASGPFIVKALVDPMPLRGGMRELVFTGVCVFALLNLGMGPNYSLLRFAIAPAALVSVEALTRGRTWAVTAGASAAATLITLAVSPEMGVAFVAGMSAVLVVRALQRDGSAWLALAAHLVFAAAVALGAATLLPASYIAAFLEGAASLPVLPGPPAILFVAAVLSAARVAGAWAASDDRTGAAVAGCAVVGLTLVPAALGRADFGHLFWNGIPVIVVGACSLPGGEHAIPKAAAKAALCVFIAGAVVLDLSMMSLGIGSGILRARTVPDRTVDRLLARSGVGERLAARVSALRAERTTPEVRSRILGLRDVAFLEAASDDLPIRLASLGRLHPVFQPGSPLGDADREATERSLEGARYLLVPSEWLTADLATSPKTVGGPGRYGPLLMFPVTLEVRHEMTPPLAGLISYVNGVFEPAWDAGRYTVMVPRAR